MFALCRDVFYCIFPLVQKKFFVKRDTWEFPFLPVCFLSPPLQLPPSFVLPPPIHCVTSSCSRWVRVLLTGRHGNLATGLQLPKVDGLWAGAPEQTEQKSVHARTRNWSFVFVRLSGLYRFLYLCFTFCLFLSFPYFSLSSLFLTLSLFLCLSVASLISRTRSYVYMVFVSRFQLIQIPGGDTRETDISRWQ